MMDNILKETSNRLNGALRFVEETRGVMIGEGILKETPNALKKYFADNECQSFALIADQNTWQAAGNVVETAIRSDGTFELEEPFLFGDEEFHCDGVYLAKVRAFLSEKAVVPIAVGSGTINDLVKRAAFEFGRPYMIVGTAASMDGYTSFGASVDIDGFKQTLSCPAPLAVLLDIDVLTAAPADMSAAGYADLIAKIPAGADWMLADFVGSEKIHPQGWSLVQDHLRDWLVEPAGVAVNDKKSLCRLIEGLVMSGLAMQVAQTSRTASGAEHLFSHLWDNQNHTFQGKVPFHGVKVGIGTEASSALYDSALQLTVDDLQAAKKRFLANPDQRRNWQIIEATVRKHFGDGPLGTQILGQSRDKYADDVERLQRFDLYIENWDALKERLRGQLIPANGIREMLRQCGAPTEPEEIGIDRNRLRQSYELAQLIRSRYNILDFARELELWDQLVSPLFEKNGFWHRRAGLCPS